MVQEMNRENKGGGYVIGILLCIGVLAGLGLWRATLTSRRSRVTAELAAMQAEQSKVMIYLANEKTELSSLISGPVYRAALKMGMVYPGMSQVVALDMSHRTSRQEEQVARGRGFSLATIFKKR